MAKESNISFGGAIISLTLFPQTTEREEHRLQMCVWETKNKYWSAYIMGGGGDSVKI